MLQVDRRASSLLHMQGNVPYSGALRRCKEAGREFTSPPQEKSSCSLFADLPTAEYLVLRQYKVEGVLCTFDFFDFFFSFSVAAFF